MSRPRVYCCAVLAAVGGHPFLSAADGQTLWDQSAFDPQGLGVIDQEFPDLPAFSSFLVSDVSTDGRAWNVSRITTWFTKGFGTWDDAGITWGRLQVYSKSGRLPADSDLAPEYPVEITLTSLGDAWQVAADTSAIAELQAIRGDFWIGLSPWADFATFGQEFHLQSTGPAFGAETALLNAGGGLGIGTRWQSWSAVGGQGDAAIRLEGNVIPTPASALALMCAALHRPRRRRA